MNQQNNHLNEALNFGGEDALETMPALANSGGAARDSSIDRSVNKALAILQNREKTNGVGGKFPKQVQLHLLPLLAEDERSMPNALARGALFNAAKASEERKYCKDKVVASLGNIAITYTGWELRQDDCSVLIALLHFQEKNTSHAALGLQVYFTAYEMLRDMGWSHNSAEYRHLRECCERLSATNLTIAYKDGSEGFAGSLLRSFAWKDEGKKMQKWVVRFEAGIARLFREDSYSILDPEIRRKLSGRAPLAQWLHMFLNSHGSPLPYTVEKYYELSESRSKSLPEFRARFKVALQRCKEAGFLEDFSIDKKTDLVLVKRAPVKRRPPVYREPIIITDPALIADL